MTLVPFTTGVVSQCAVRRLSSKRTWASQGIKCLSITPTNDQYRGSNTMRQRGGHKFSSPNSTWTSLSKKKSGRNSMNIINQLRGKGFSSAKSSKGSKSANDWSKGFNPTYRPMEKKQSNVSSPQIRPRKVDNVLHNIDSEVDLGLSQPPDLYFLSCGTMIVHPHKKTMGEDAFFIAGDGTAIGVADGIGAWSDVNVDSGEYSRDLMNFACTAFESDPTISDDPLNVLIDAYNRTTSKGSCTACLLALRGDVLHTAHIGDSGFMILRRSSGSSSSSSATISSSNRVSGNDECVAKHCAAACSVNQESDQSEPKTWRMVYQSVEQQHFFNCPVQLGTGSNDYPTDAETLKVPLAPGDIVLTATDGLFDNLFVNDICAIVNRLSTQPLANCGAVLNPPRHVKTGAIEPGQIDSREWLQNISATLAREASEAASSVTRRSPFATNARKAGYLFEGGKLDDITVIASLVTCARGIEDGSQASS